ncbi:MAG: universal stress protein [Alphaproteobacteria bacterium]|nr:universal stress protein [Alphaproteobacteria bacterium]MCB9974638.1 universal stress protein [Rhodospirillales bacterium]
MIKSILLATDLSPQSDRAMERAIKLAVEKKCELHILHIVPNYIAKKLSSSLKTETEELLKSFIADYKESKKLKVKTTVSQQNQSVYAEILACAHKVKASLIVMGLHRKTSLPDMFIGTTAERVVRKGAWPVLLVKNKPVGPYRNVVCATDFSTSARQALRLAVDFSPSAKFHAIHAYEIPVYAIETGPIYLETKAAVLEQDQKALDKFIETECKSFVRKYKKMSLALSGKLVNAPVLESINKHIKNTKADLLTLGAHGRAGFAHALLGSLAGTLLADPPCDILVAREK